MTTYVVGGGEVAPSLAIRSIADHVGDDGAAVVMDAELSSWAEAVRDALDLSSVEELSSLEPSDVVIAVPTNELVEFVAEFGATLLDVSEGLIPVAIAEATEVPEVPDVEAVPPAPVDPEPEPLPVPPKKRTRKKTAPPSGDPVPTAPEAAEAAVESPAPVVQVVTPSRHEVPAPAEAEKALLLELIGLHLSSADVPTLYSILDSVRPR